MMRFKKNAIVMGKKISDFTCGVDAGGIPFRLVLEINPIPGHVRFRLLEGDFHL
jgi:hypothetical protein